MTRRRRRARPPESTALVVYVPPSPPALAEPVALARRDVATVDAELVPKPREMVDGLRRTRVGRYVQR